MLWDAGVLAGAKLKALVEAAELAPKLNPLPAKPGVLAAPKAGVLAAPKAGELPGNEKGCELLAPKAGVVLPKGPGALPKAGGVLPKAGVLELAPKAWVLPPPKLKEPADAPKPGVPLPNIWEVAGLCLQD